MENDGQAPRQVQSFNEDTELKPDKVGNLGGGDTESDGERPILEELLCQRFFKGNLQSGSDLCRDVDESMREATEQCQ